MLANAERSQTMYGAVIPGAYYWSQSGGRSQQHLGVRQPRAEGNVRRDDGIRLQPGLGEAGGAGQAALSGCGASVMNVLKTHVAVV